MTFGTLRRFWGNAAWGQKEMAAERGIWQARRQEKKEMLWALLVEKPEAAEQRGVLPSSQPEPVCHVLAGVDGGEWCCKRLGEQLRFWLQTTGPNEWCSTGSGSASQKLREWSAPLTEAIWKEEMPTVQSLAAWHCDRSAALLRRSRREAQTQPNPTPGLCSGSHTQAADRLISPWSFLIRLHC